MWLYKKVRNRFIRTSQAFFLSGLEGVIRYRFTQESSNIVPVAERDTAFRAREVRNESPLLFDPLPKKPNTSPTISGACAKLGTQMAQNTC